jgi:hypothetical protein
MCEVRVSPDGADGLREMFEVTRESVATEPVYSVVGQGRGLGIAEEPKPTPVCSDDRISGRRSPTRGRALTVKNVSIGDGLRPCNAVRLWPGREQKALPDHYRFRLCD